MTPHESATSARKVKGAERTVEAIALRQAGLTYRQIGERLGITEQGAHNSVTRAMQRMNAKIADEVPELRRLELERLDRMLLAIWPQVVGGNFGAIDRALRIMERRARLCGLDAPIKSDLTTDGQPIRTDVIRIVVHDDRESDANGA